LSCTTGAECTSGVCADGVCCDKACGLCQACTAAKKGSGIDGVCEPVAADSDPDDECAQGPNYPTSCLADGMCDGSGKCREFAKDTVSCGATQCNQGQAEGLLCNGAGQCLTAKTSCEPYKCENNQCLQACVDDNDCVPSAFCGSQGTCADRLALGSSCTAGKECASGFCVDSVCCVEACGGQCEACNVAPNEGTCVPVTGEPVGSRPACEGDGSACNGQCDGVNAAACSFPPAGKACGAPSCAAGEQTSSSCDGAGACVATTGDCSPFACGAETCRTSCSDDAHCANGFSCDTTSGDCVPAAGKCAADGVTLETSTGETKSCAPYRCQGGECSEPCVTSSDCVSGFACDQATCVALSDPASSDDGGCGCRVPASHGSQAWALLLALLAGALRRSRARPAP
jgi:hypothetical protein